MVCDAGTTFQRLLFPAIRSITALVRTLELSMLNVHHQIDAYQALRAYQAEQATHLSSLKGNDSVERTLLVLKAIASDAFSKDGEALFVSFSLKLLAHNERVVEASCRWQGAFFVPNSKERRPGGEPGRLLLTDACEASKGNVA